MKNAFRVIAVWLAFASSHVVPAMPQYTYEITVDVNIRKELYRKCKAEKLSDKCHFWSYERSRVVVPVMKTAD